MRKAREALIKARKALRKAIKALRKALRKAAPFVFYTILYFTAKALSNCSHTLRSAARGLAPSKVLGLP